jgi:cobalt-zinc-cadmium efflux system outer membrane protein
LRSAFVQTLQAKAVLALTRANLAYYDGLLVVSRNRFQAGDIAQVDLNRLELQRVQFEADVQTAETNLRTAKIQLLTLMNDRTPVEQFDVAGPFEFSERILPLEEFRNIAVDARPDLKAAAQAIDKAETDHKLAVANGSTDPTFSYQHGGASLLDFLNAQDDYRSVQLNYLNLIGSYMTAASQLNLAVGREAIQ